MNTTDTEITVANLCAHLGLKLECTPPIVTKRDDWDCFSFQCFITCKGKPVWNGPYHKGLGHVKIPKGEPSFLHFSENERNLIYTLQRKPNATVRPEFEELKRSLYAKLASREKLTCTLLEVLASLMSDGAAYFDGESFEDWASNFGYDTDSRKAEATWKACVETGMAFSRALSTEEITNLREACAEL